MQASLMHRVRRPWPLVAVAVAAVAWWWRPWAAGVVPAPQPTPMSTVVAQPILATPVAAAPATVSTAALAGAAVPRPAPALKLVGTTLGGASSFATLRRTTNSQLLLLYVGDRVDGLVVTAIEADRVVLGGGPQAVVIEIDRTAAQPVASTPARAVTAAGAAQAQRPPYADGEAPWDAGADFRH